MLAPVTLGCRSPPPSQKKSWHSLIVSGPLPMQGNDEMVITVVGRDMLLLTTGLSNLLNPSAAS